MKAEDIAALLRTSGVTGWTVSDVKKNGWEFYFIRHRLDQNRVVRTEHITITVYEALDDGKFLGSASDEVAPDASEEEVRQSVAALRARAALVHNPMYALRKPEENGKTGGSDMTCEAGPDLTQKTAGTKAGEQADPAGLAENFIRTMNDIPETQTEDINSYEIFTSLMEKRLITSTGLDQTQSYPSSMLEVVTNAREKSGDRGGLRGREIELYRLYQSGTCDRAALKRDICRTLQYGKDRLHTTPTPRLEKLPLVLSTADVVQVCQYFVDRMSAQYVYQKLSDWTIGKPIAADIRGDKVSVRTKRTLPNSSMNFLWDAEGAGIREEELIRDGVAVQYWGNAIFSSYLGLKNTFMVSNYEVSGGHLPEAQIRSGRYLEVVEFSDFQVDSMTGDIFGEIRLGYLHDKEKVTIVSGGSVSGSMRDYVRDLYFSREQVQYDRALVPSVIKLMDVTVTGAASRTAE